MKKTPRTFQRVRKCVLTAGRKTETIHALVRRDSFSGTGA